MPGYNHKPWCECGWCVKESGQTDTFSISNFYNSILTPRVLTTTQAGRSRTYPTKCPWQCGEAVYYHSNGYGDSVYFDWLGSPWQIHSCFESYWEQERERKKLLGLSPEHQHIMSPNVDERERRGRLLRGAIDSIEGYAAEEAIASSMGFFSKIELRKYYGELYRPVEFSEDSWSKEVRHAINRGENLQFNLTVGFRDAIFGCEKTIEIKHLEARLDGTVIPTIQTLKVNVPPGVNTGKRLCIPAEGDASESNGEPGDLYVCLTVLLTEGKFRREGINILSELMLTAEEASQGGEIDVVTIYGQRKIRLPTQISNGTRLSIKGYGVPNPYCTGVHILEIRVI
jgi:DnaJ C terminal domain